MSDLTASEQASVRVALRFLKTRAGGWEALARVLHFGPSTLGNVASERTRKAPTASMALRIARLAQVTVDDVLAGRYPGPNVCAHCGARKESAA